MTTTSSRPPFGTGSADQLAAHAAQAARMIRALSTGPDMIALRVERIRGQVDTGPVVRAAKWGCFAATYAMNVWAAWELGVASGVVLHSVPPLVVLAGRGRPDPARPAHRSRPPRRPANPYRPANPCCPDWSGAHRGPGRSGTRPPRTGGPDHRRRGAGPGCGPCGTPRRGATTRAREPHCGPRWRRRNRRPGRSALNDEVGDGRVLELAALIADGAPVTGPQAAVIHAVSERTGRRLVADARTHLDTRRTRPGLHLVDHPTAAGDTP